MGREHSGVGGLRWTEDSPSHLKDTLKLIPAPWLHARTRALYCFYGLTFLRNQKSWFVCKMSCLIFKPLCELNNTCLRAASTLLPSSLQHPFWKSRLFLSCLNTSLRKNVWALQGNAVYHGLYFSQECLKIFRDKADNWRRSSHFQ